MLTFLVKVIPNASQYRWKLESELLKCYIPAQPTDNRANKMFIKRLAKLLQLPASSISILQGATNKIKHITIDADITYEELIDQVLFK